MMEDLDRNISKVARFLDDMWTLPRLENLFKSNKLYIIYGLDQYRRTECICRYDVFGHVEKINISIYYSHFWTTKRFETLGVYVPNSLHQKPMPATAYFEIKLAHELTHAYEYYIGLEPSEERATWSELTFAYTYYNYYFRTYAEPIKHKKGNIICRMN